MIYTVRNHQGKRVDLIPNPNGSVTLYTGHGNEPIHLDPAHVGALIVGLEVTGAEAEKLAQAKATA